MRIWLGVAFACLMALSGCETLSESYAVERSDLINTDGIHVYSDLMENAWDSSQYWQFRASNYGSYPFCVSVGLESVSYSNGYDMGQVYYLAPGQSMDIGYVYGPADFGVDAQTWAPSDDGRC